MARFGRKGRVARWWAVLALVAALLVAAGCGGGGQPASGDTGSGTETGSGAGAGSGTGTGTGGEKSLLDEIKERGYMTFATDGAYPPMEFPDPENPGELIGFDIDLGKAIAEKLGVEYRVEVAEWEGLLAGLEARRFDAVMSAMNITEERQKSADFVQYFEMGQMIVVPKGNPQGIQSLDDLKGKVIAVQIGTTNEEIARGIEGATVKTYQTFPDALQEVAAGRADATILDEPVARYYANIEGDKYEYVGVPFETAPVGIALPKGEDELVQAVQQALDQLKQDGTYDQIYAKWFGGQ
ncbi:extracellular solute-binding protein family 3 [Thermaerobacter marianensis DSM 12885]|uniref:Extracellular solute-binding protein family 3 n=1 Tax=Thermaerobacter marianensis (strain ATCC 700841 / DSM 12885 / JCM 10246 / 7p75a) TaxID=644966 RepID=E6SGU6_THEM7|nr:basic amino acid ABC transporter substrate-binding protein [Thermaerobacter marianensis]ADU51680.1 extracellular solute-binding protein family 3 [Thermaerobacter marianensis DSM 12885]